MLYIVAGAVIVVGLLVLLRASIETDADRARTYPEGSYERNHLLNRTNQC